MALKTTIQQKIIALISAGTYTKVTYTDSIPIDTEESVSPTSVSCNEISGNLSTVAAKSSCIYAPILTNWRFEAHIEFTCEIDASYFLLNELKGLTFSVDGFLVQIIPSGDFNHEHPPRQGAHNGTKMNIGFTVNTRR